MIIDESSANHSTAPDLKAQVYQIVVENRISLLSMISDISGSEENLVRSVLKELVDEGTLIGSFAPDGQRFFLSEVKVSDAPVAIVKDEGFFIEERDTTIPKIIFITGIVIMIAGYISRSLVAFEAIMEHVGGAVLILGMAVLIAGWIMISRANPPSKIM
ncbi:MAG: hypothetical protein AM325_007005 [Candidatus Thorarchaeota archaeon SMTZ1-45]